MIRALAFAAALSGCGTSWIITQVAGKQSGWDESVREEIVPRPGFDETLVVTLLDRQIQCNAAQTGRNLVAHAGFRYGRRWMSLAAVAFVLEGALGAAWLLSANMTEHPDRYLYGGFFALDAAITLPLIFLPKKEIYREDEVPVTTHLRDDCPEGLALVVAGETFAVDATGHLGELGDTALAEWAKAPGGPIFAMFADQSFELVVDTRTTPSRSASATFHVTPGRFAR